MNKDFEIMFETGVDEMSWDDTVSAVSVSQSGSSLLLVLCRRTIGWAGPSAGPASSRCWSTGSR